MTLDARVIVERPAFTLDVTVRVDDAECVGVVGPNGAGKTTLLRVIAGLEPLTRGCIELDGTVMDRPESNAFVAPEHRNVAMVFQDHRLFPTMSARDNVAYGMRRKGVPRREANERALEWLASVDLLAHADRLPSQLSGGQSQRVALVRALAVEPAVLLLDEPFAAVDTESRVRLRDWLGNYLDNVACMRLVVSHDAADVAAMTTRVLTL